MPAKRILCDATDAPHRHRSLHLVTGHSGSRPKRLEVSPRPARPFFITRSRHRAHLPDPGVHAHRDPGAGAAVRGRPAGSQHRQQNPQPATEAAAAAGAAAARARSAQRDGQPRPGHAASGLGLFRLRRSTVVSILATILTYVIVMHQFHVLEPLVCGEGPAKEG